MSIIAKAAAMSTWCFCCRNAADTSSSQRSKSLSGYVILRFQIQMRCVMKHVAYSMSGSLLMSVMLLIAVNMRCTLCDASNTNRSFFSGFRTNACGVTCRSGTNLQTHDGKGTRNEFRSSLFMVFSRPSGNCAMVLWFL